MKIPFAYSKVHKSGLTRIPPIVQRKLKLQLVPGEEIEWRVSKRAVYVRKARKNYVIGPV